MSLLKIQNFENLVKDTRTNAVVNTSKSEFQLYMKRTRERNLHVPAFISDVARLGDRLLQSVGLYNQNVHVLSEQNMNIFCSNKKIKDDLGFQPACTLEEGMRKSIDWCLSKGLKI